MSTDSDRDPIDLVAEEFAERYRRGEQPALSEFVRRFPERESEIRELFPALLIIERLKPDDDDDIMAPLPDRLGEYRIVREIGRGGMGVVYEAVQEPLGRRVALKVFHNPILARPDAAERFRREARAAAKLHHTNIVPVFGVGESVGVSYYAMQFIEGQGLERVLRDIKRLRQRHDSQVADGGMANILVGSHDYGRTARLVSTTAGSNFSQSARSPRTSYYRHVTRIGMQVAEALAHAHQRGVLHRDIKPSNLLLDWHGNIWVTDFGLAKSDEECDLTQSGDAVGTIRFMAPERFSGASSPQSDIFSVGVTLYEMLTLQPIIDGCDRLQLIERIRTGQPPAPRAIDPTIPRDLETIVLKCVAKDPRDRYCTASDLADDLRRCMTDRPIHARRISLAEQAVRWAQRNPALAALSTAAVVFLLAGLALTYAQWRRAEHNYALAQQQADRAAKSFSWAHNAMTTLLHDMEPLAHAREPSQIRDAQQQMLANAAKLNEQFRDHAGPTPDQQHELLNAILRGGLFRQALGDLRGAEAAFQQVAATSFGGQDPPTAMAVGRAHIHLGYLRKNQARMTAALAEFSRGLDVLEHSSASLRESAEARHHIAVASVAIAETTAAHGNLEDANRKYAAAHERIKQLLQGLDSSRHEAAQIRFLGGQNDIMWAALLYRQRRHADELACYRRAAEVAQQLLQKEADDPLFRKLANQSFVGIADALRRAGDVLRAEPAYQKALEHSGWLVRQFPHEPDYRAMHARNVNNTIAVLRSDNAGTALLLAEEAVHHSWFAVVRRPDAALYRNYLKTCLETLTKAAKKLSTDAALTRIAEQILTGPEWDQGEAALTAAMLWNQAAEIAPSADARNHARRGIEAISIAVDRGFRDGDRLRQAPEFDALRRYGDFADLLARIAQFPK